MGAVEVRQARLFGAQVSRNKERLCRLESAVMRSRAGEER